MPQLSPLKWGVFPVVVLGFFLWFLVFYNSVLLKSCEIGGEEGDFFEVEWLW